MAGLLDTQGIENFYDTAISNDFARQNLFRIIALGQTNFSPSQLLYLTSTTLPGRSVTDVPTPFMGLEFHVPGTVKYPNSGGWQVTFRCDSSMDIRSALEAWSISIFDDRTSTGNYSIPDKGPAGQIVMALIDKSGNPIPNKTYTLYGAWLQQVNELTVNLTSAGEILEQQATIAYQYWRITA